jgi:hypothetical protein
MPQDQVPEQSPTAVAEALVADPPGPLAATAGGVQPRQCGRCRLLFEGDPTLSITAQPEWWLCPGCRMTLLGK